MLFKLKKEGTQRTKYKTVELTRPTSDHDKDFEDSHATTRLFLTSRETSDNKIACICCHYGISEYMVFRVRYLSS